MGMTNSVEDIARIRNLMLVLENELAHCQLDESIWSVDYVWSIPRPAFVKDFLGGAPQPEVNVTQMSDELEFLESWADDPDLLSLPFMLDKMADVLRGCGASVRPKAAHD